LTQAALGDVEGQDERRAQRKNGMAPRERARAGSCEAHRAIFEKGGRVYIEGRLETRDYTDKDKVKRYVTEIVLRPYGSTITMLDGLKASAASEPPEAAPGEPAAIEDDVIPL
jgi:single-stranded DNA-binding protein